jgi:D-aminopeptidase
VTTLIPAGGEAPRDVAGRWRCDELDAELTITEAGGALYGAFSGFLGQGRMELLEPIGRELLALPCPRALDHTPPGDWTLAVTPEGGKAVSITVGCWLARGLVYRRIG